MSFPRNRIIPILAIAGVVALLLVCCVSSLSSAAFTHPTACDSVSYYRAYYSQCDDESDAYPPWFWLYHHNYYVYVNDNMDAPLYHPVGWYTSPTFYQTRYYISGNGGSRIDNYHVGSSPARARYGGGGRGSGTNSQYGGGGRGNCCSSGSYSKGKTGSNSGSRFGGGGHGGRGKP